MNTIIVRTSEPSRLSYRILIGSRMASEFKKWLPRNATKQTLVIITDHTLRRKYGNSLLQSLKEQNIKVCIISFQPGEKAKCYAIKEKIEIFMLKHQCSKYTTILALGGGVVGDIAGFVAATYMRGIPYIQIPTTLLAMVDSSIGGKTGINMAQGKNLIGSFWHPKVVVTDLRFLNSLTRKHLINGLMEVIKIFLTCNANGFGMIFDNIQKILNADQDLLKKIILKSIKIKAGIVEKDTNENSSRVILNLGHTIGHALEKESNYKMLHGFAVGFGIVVEAKIAQLLGLLDVSCYEIIRQNLLALGINGKKLNKFNPKKIIDTTKADKKNKFNECNYVLLKKIGSVHVTNNVYIHPVQDDVVRQAILEVSGGL